MIGERKSEPYPLTLDEFLSFDDNGFLVVRNLYSHDECDFINSMLERHANAKHDLIMQPHRYKFLKAYDPRDKTPEVEEEIRQTSEFLYSFMRDTRAVSILEKLKRNALYEMSYEGNMEKTRDLMGVMSQMIFKYPGTGDQKGWNVHQDNAYTMNPNGHYITTNTFLADADNENGTMYLYPGSHKEPILPFEEVKTFDRSSGRSPGNNIKEIPPKYAKVDVTFKKGDTLVLHGNCLHGSYENVSSRPRPLYMNTYIPNGEFFVPGRKAQRRTFVLKLLEE